MKMTEQTFNIPLRREIMKAPKYKRAKKAIHAVREFVSKHMKSQDVLIGKYLNLKIWEHGIKNPPHHVSVNASKDDKGIVKVELVGAPKEVKKEEKAKKESKPITPAKAPETPAKDSTATATPVSAETPAKTEEPKVPEKIAAPKKVYKKKEAVTPSA